MKIRTRGGRAVRRAPRLAAVAVGALVSFSVVAAPANAVPLFPGGPDIPLPALPALPPPPELPQLLPPFVPPEPEIGPANFATPSINPSAGETVGVAQPVVVRFDAPVADRAVAGRAIRVTAEPAVDGEFYWISDSQVRWKPFEFWPAHTSVTVRAGDATSTFRIGESVIAYADDDTKQITVSVGGEVVKTMPTSMGKPGHETPNGTYIIGEKHRDMYMDSSTYGVPVDSPEGYRTYVEYATRMSYSGIFVHGAPWSVAQQGVTNVSHGCLNVSNEDAKWFYDTFRKGDAVIVSNTDGGTLPGWDGLGDWNR
ncbi:hypothetical protein DW322_06815 [Rhodococcus rhodnii]|nr:Ig-like domain-containing protein [Rhodococcus rhodnii]TXG89975.1 hypothetical protein DW322_06815 [Rhodococcus rhodnii]